MLSPPIDRECLVDASRPRYEVIAEEFRLAIRSGALEVGQRLPTFRELASHLDVSVTTVAGAYEMLRHEGRVQCTVGRGTFVAGEPPTNGRSTEASTAHLEIRLLQTMAWRRRTLSATANRLRISFPDALDCTSGKPNVDVVERAAAGGVLVAPGEPFFLQAGNKRCVRLSAGHVKPDEAPRVAEALADAIKMSVEATALFHV